jgi:hypothetical protein
MKKMDFILMRDKTTSARWEMGDAKSESYTRGSDDRLENFRSNAKKLGLTQEVIWSVYFGKHIDALFAYTSKGIESPEGIESNIDDAQNYLDLLRAMVRDALPNEGNNLSENHVNILGKTSTTA